MVDANDISGVFPSTATESQLKALWSLSNALINPQGNQPTLYNPWQALLRGPLTAGIGGYFGNLANQAEIARKLAAQNQGPQNPLSGLPPVASAPITPLQSASPVIQQGASGGSPWQTSTVNSPASPPSAINPPSSAPAPNLNAAIVNAPPTMLPAFMRNTSAGLPAYMPSAGAATNPATSAWMQTPVTVPPIPPHLPDGTLYNPARGQWKTPNGTIYGSDAQTVISAAPPTIQSQ